MRRLFILMMVALALSCGSCAAAGTAQAKEKSISSKGSIIYRQDDIQAALYAEDLLLLKDKLATTTGDVFDPGCYVQNPVPEKENDTGSAIVYCGLENWRTVSGEKLAETEIEEDVEILAQPEEGDISVSANSLEENSSENEETEDMTDSTDTSEGDSSEMEDTEESSDSTDLSEGDSLETEDTEDISASTDLSEENSSADEDEEDTSVSAENSSETEDVQPGSDLSVEIPQEIGNDKEQVN